MKHLQKLRLFTIVLFGLLTFSCQNEEVTSEEDYIDPSAILYEPQTVDPSELSDFNGLKVKHRFPTTISTNTALKKMGKKNQKYSKINNPYLKKDISSPSDQLDDDTFSAKVEEIIASYDLPFTGDTEADIAQIFEDFPEITPETIEENIELIEDYYADNLTFLVEKEAADNLSSDNKHSKANGNLQSKRGEVKLIEDTCWHADNPSHINSWFGTSFSNNLINKTLGRVAMAKAGVNAEALELVNFIGLGTGDTKRDAYRHMVWQAALAKHYMSSSKVRKRRFAYLIGYSYEYNGRLDKYLDGEKTKEEVKQEVLNDPGTWMDLNNNKIGRDIWDQNSSYRQITYKVPYWYRWRLRWRTVRITYGVNDANLDQISRAAKSRLTYSSVHFPYINEDGDFEPEFDPEDKTGVYRIYNLPNLLRAIKAVRSNKVVYISTSTDSKYY